MANEVKLYYGDGSCYIHGDNIIGLQINYKGGISIEDKTNSSYVLNANDNMILIFPIAETTESLTNLFEYVGNISITSIIAVNRDEKEVGTIIKKLADYAEMLGVAESITLKSEELNRGNKKGHIPSKTSLNQKTIQNLHTKNDTRKLYTEDGEIYEGFYHIHLKDSTVMTGKDHSDVSKDLYFKVKNKFKPTKTQNNGVKIGSKSSSKTSNIY